MNGRDIACFVYVSRIGICVGHTVMVSPEEFLWYLTTVRHLHLRRRIRRSLRHPPPLRSPGSHTLHRLQ